MEKYFITGIDTNIGKTVATAWLARRFIGHGKTAITQKLIQTGCAGVSEDIVAHRKMMGIDLLPEDLDGTTCAYVMSYPASPHIAAEIDDVSVDFGKIADNTERLSKKYDVVLVEGAGGLMVPLSRGYLTAEYVTDNNLPVFLVVSSRLGSLNHALLSLEVMRGRGLKLAGIIYNTYPVAPKPIEDSTREYLKEYIARYFEGAQFLEMGKVDYE